MMQRQETQSSNFNREGYEFPFYSLPQFQFYPIIEKLIKKKRNRTERFDRFPGSQNDDEYQFYKKSKELYYRALVEARKNRQKRQFPKKKTMSSSKTFFNGPQNRKAIKHDSLNIHAIDQLKQLLSHISLANYPQVTSNLPQITKLLTFINKDYPFWNKYQLNDVKKTYKGISLQNSFPPHFYQLLFPQIQKQRDIFNKKNQSAVFCKSDDYLFNFESQMIGLLAEEDQRKAKQLEKQFFERDLSSQIGSIDQFFQVQANFKDIVFKIQAQLYQKILEHKINKTKSYQDIYDKVKLSQNIFKDVPMNTKDICCTQIFYSDRNIYDDKINRCKLAIIQPDYENEDLLQTKSNKITSQICALLNSGGGYILLDCQRHYLEVLSKGSLITEGRKIKIIQQIANILKNIFPHPQLDKHIFTSFVPVAQWICQQDYVGSNFGYYLKPNYLVTRIVVRPPSVRKQTYCLLNQGYYYTAMRYKSLLQSQAYFKVQSFPKELVCNSVINAYDFQEPQKLYYLSEQNNLFDHQKCIQPKEEMEIVEKYKDQPHQKYEFVSCLILSHLKHLESVRLKLANQEISCEVSSPFQSWNEEFSQVIAVVKHSVPITVMQDLISFKNDYRFEQKDSILLQITCFVKLIRENIQMSELKMITQNLKYKVGNMFRDCVIQVWRYENDAYEFQYYFKTNDRVCNLFICLYLNSIRERATFANRTYMLNAQQIL